MADSDRTRDDDLVTVADELSDVLRDLQGIVQDDSRRRPPRGPFGLPRPPTPRELAEFADEVAIPAVIAVLEVNIRLLEALQHGIRMAERGRDARDRSDAAAAAARDVSRTTLARLETALDDLQRAVEEGAFPENETARTLLEDARRLRNEIDDRVREAQNRSLSDYASADGNGGEPVRVESEDAEDRPSVDVDVDAELESLKREYGEGGDESDGGNGDGDDDSPAAD